ncbi:hypothetical protein K501DRAFT_328826 [Backusella circina FSU 941]|nr:hypothetical protein K501DRAFT_328826 [Backusella circina FSU 941]
MLRSVILLGFTLLASLAMEEPGHTSPVTYCEPLNLGSVLAPLQLGFLNIRAGTFLFKDDQAGHFAMEDLITHKVYPLLYDAVTLACSNLLENEMLMVGKLVIKDRLADVCQAIKVQHRFSPSLNRSFGNNTASNDKTTLSNNTATGNGLEYRHIAEIKVLLWRFRVEAGGYEYYTWYWFFDFQAITTITKRLVRIKRSQASRPLRYYITILLCYYITILLCYYVTIFITFAMWLSGGPSGPWSIWKTAGVRVRGWIEDHAWTVPMSCRMGPVRGHH